MGQSRSKQRQNHVRNRKIDIALRRFQPEQGVTSLGDIQRAWACGPIDKDRTELGKLPLDIGARATVVAEGKSDFRKRWRAARMLIGKIDNCLKDTFIRITWISHWLSFSNTTCVVYNKICTYLGGSIHENPKPCNTQILKCKLLSGFCDSPPDFSLF